MISKRNFAIVLGWLVVSFLVFGHAAVGEERGTEVKFYDFESKPGPSWTTQSTAVIGSTRALGLFNDVNNRYSKGTQLALTDLPPGSQVNLSFDLYLIGTWDSEGKLADRFAVTTQDERIVLELKEFPNAFADEEQTQPLGNRGKVFVEGRERAYWVVPQEFTLSPADIGGKEVTLNFRGHLTGRKTEFWAIDNVRVRLNSTPKSNP